MARWVLDRKNCSEGFAYSLIPDTPRAIIICRRLLHSQPQGRERECPNCKTKSTYQQTGLRFQNG
jgi:hypothetical protein